MNGRSTSNSTIPQRHPPRTVMPSSRCPSTMSCGTRPDFLLDSLSYGAISHVEIVAGLQIDPELGACTEVARQTNRRVRGEGAASAHDIVGARARHLDRMRQFVDADAHRGQEFVPQYLARMNRRQPATGPDIGEIDLPPIDILALDAHRPTPQ